MSPPPCRPGDLKTHLIDSGPASCALSPLASCCFAGACALRPRGLDPREITAGPQVTASKGPRAISGAFVHWHPVRNALNFYDMICRKSSMKAPRLPRPLCAPNQIKGVSQNENPCPRGLVIGGGVVGCSVLYHLTKLGWSDVMLIERSELTSGSTWHAAGGFHTLNGDTNMAALQGYTIRLYKELEEPSPACPADCTTWAASRWPTIEARFETAEGRTRQAPLHGAGHRDSDPGRDQEIYTMAL